MRVLYLARPAAGGVLRFFQDVLPLLRREGVEVEVACPSEMHSALPEVVTRRWNLTDHPRLVNDLRCALDARRWARDFDLLHAHGLRTAGVLALAPPKRWLFSLHNLPPDRLSPLARTALQRASRHALQIHCVSQAVRESWVRLFPDSTGKCVVVHGGVRVQFTSAEAVERSWARRQWGLPEDRPVALCVARLMVDKGIDVLIRALSHAPEWYTLIVGEGPERENLAQIAEQMGVGERVRFTGYLPSLDAVWSACDVAVVPSRREGFGLFALEAMAAGKPVIASAVGGLTETVLHERTGWLVSPEDPVALADALKTAYRERERWHEMGARGREHVLQHFTWEQTAKQLLECYRRLLST